MQTIDTFIQRMTMYKLVAWLLGAMAIIAIMFGFSGSVGYSGTSLLISWGIFMIVAWVANFLFAKLYGAATNTESAVITGLILFFIFSPPSSVEQGLMLGAIAIIAMASKYLIAYRQRHIFNPAALAAVVAGLVGFQYASWWVATAAMMPFVLVAGFVILRKTRRTPMFTVFFAVAFVIAFLAGIGEGQSAGQLAKNILVSYPFLFLGTIMLTEPLTTPPVRRQRVIYAIIVAVLAASSLQIGSFLMTPEAALVIGNLYAWTTTVRQRVRLQLRRKVELAPTIYEFEFTTAQPFAFRPGQYMETTLPIPVQDTDIRGNRRTFTIASSPTEQTIKFGIKFAERSSKFKQALQALPEGGYLYGAQVAGDFLLPKNTNEKVAFIAGGIGITPFRSHIQHMIDTKQSRDIVLLYCVTDERQIVYRDILEQAKTVGIKTKFVTGFIDAEILQQAMPDYTERRFFVSGSPPMVSANKKLLAEQGVKHIHTDFFQGY